MSVELHPDLKEMTAIKDQMKFLDSLMQSFTRNLSHYLNDQLIKISVDYGSVSEAMRGQLLIQKTIHVSLLTSAL